MPALSNMNLARVVSLYFNMSETPGSSLYKMSASSFFYDIAILFLIISLLLIALNSHCGEKARLKTNL
jgi:hypothetical protein